MSRRTGHYPRVPALCNECGTQREVAWRTTGKFGRYKCATCRQQTSHAIVAPAEWGDYWERKNDEARGALTAVERLIEHFERFGVTVRDRPGALSDGLHCLIFLIVDEGRYEVELADGLTIEAQRACLERAWTWLTPDRLWDEGPLKEDEDGVRYKVLFWACHSCKAGRYCSAAVPARLRDGAR